MLDPKYFREQIEFTAQCLLKRGFVLDVAAIKILEEKRKALQIDVQKLQNERNLHSKEIGIAKSKGNDASKLLAATEIVGAKLTEREAELKSILQELFDIASQVPNLPHESVPEGKNSEQNLEVRRFGKPRQFTFTPRDHVDLGEQLGFMDFARAAKISGARFVVLTGGLARLQRALIQFMLDVHTKEHGYQEVYVPNLVNAASLFGTGQLPKFKDDQFNVAGDSGLTLIPTAEVPVTNLLRDEILTAEQLPRKYVCYSPCYRSEAGSYGKDMRGMIRNHQFEKVELVRFEQPKNSYQAHEELTKHAEVILQRLELPYRVVTLCAGDMGFSAAKTYDLEVWLPSQNVYREISSCSNFEDFQARRMQTRYKNPETRKTELVHTLNGSGLAVGRTLVAILENYQEADGSIKIPQILHAYMDGVQVISKGQL